MNVGVVTTGLEPLVVGSVETFQHQGFDNRLIWDLTGGSASLKIIDPTGASTTYAATISGGCAFVTWAVAGPVGTWFRQWTVTSADGRHQVSRRIVFEVAA